MQNYLRCKGSYSILEKGVSYEVSFDAYAAADRELEVNVEMAEDPWTTYLPELQYFDLTDTKQTYSFVFTMDSTTDENSRIGFNVSTSTHNVTIDNVSVKEVVTPVVSQGMSPEAFGTNIYYRNSKIMVEATDFKNNRLNIKVYNLRGKLIKTGGIQGGSEGVKSHVLSMEETARGLYIVEVLSKGKLLEGLRV